MGSSDAERSADRPDFALFDEALAAAMERLGVPGAAAGLIYGGSEHVVGLGVTSIEHPLPVDGDTLFQVGSITKTVTGTAVMRLVELGLLELDAPVRTYLPELRLADEGTVARLTLRHLLTHTAGWQSDYFYNAGSDADALARYVARMSELPQLTPVGTVWAYNSPGLSLAGRVIEVVTGQSYEAAIRELVLAPLGMARSCFTAEEAITHRVVAGHYARGGEALAVVHAWAIPRALRPSGGLVTTVHDMLRYLRLHLGGGPRLLAPESLALMQAAQVQAGGKADACGLTWMLKDLDGGRIVRHGGGTSGQWSECLLAPERGFGLILLTNAEAGEALNDETSRWALRRYLGMEEPALTPLSLPESELAAYAGRYEAAFATVDLSVHDGELIAQVTYRSGFPTKDSPPPPLVPPVRCTFYRPDRMVVTEPPLQGYRGEFLRGVQGEVEWMRFNGRIYVKRET